MIDNAINIAIKEAELNYIATINLGTGLIILMSVNIVLGTINSLFESEFQASRFFKGIGRAVVLILCFCAVYIAGIINKNTLAINIGLGSPPIDIIDAMHAMLLAGFYTYSKQVFLKLKMIVDGGAVPERPDMPDEPVVPEAPPDPEEEQSEMAEEGYSRIKRFKS